MSTASTAHLISHDPDFASLKQHVIASTGLAYYADKDGDLAARIWPRLAQLALSGCGAYLSLLRDREAGEAERHFLIGQLTIGETYFFRHTEQFDALRDVVLPDLIQRNESTRRLRIWSAGCAIGAEAYSLAILLKTHFAHQLAGWDIRILGTDINRSFLSRAGRGEFDERALRSTPDVVRQTWFSQSGRTWIIYPGLKEWVSFQYHNLVEDPCPSILHGLVALDLILCRNVMIYFDWDVIQRVLNQFHDCLADGGWLAVGHAESNTEVFRAYRTVNVPGATLYQKSHDHAALDHWPLLPRPVQSSLLHGLPAVSAAGPYAPWSPAALPVVPDTPANAPVIEPAAPALSGLALVRRLAEEGKWREAAGLCDDLLAHDRLNAAVHFYQALIMEQAGHLNGAEQALRRALYLDRTFVLARYQLALLFRKSGDREAAARSLRSVQSLLAGQRGDQTIAEADGLTVAELGELTAMHLDLLRQ